MTSLEKIAGPLGTDGCLEGSLVLEEAVSSAGPILSLCELLHRGQIFVIGPAGVLANREEEEKEGEGGEGRERGK